MKIRPLTNSCAFTLIEILVVTSIISLFSSVIVNESKESRLKSEDAHMKTESHQMAGAVNLYRNDNGGKVPVGTEHQNRMSDIVYEFDPVDNGLAYNSSMQLLVDGGYVSEIPTSPNGKSYSYYVTEDENRAMFGVELNNESSGSSSKNSCTFLQIDIYDPVGCEPLNDYLYDGGSPPEDWVTMETGNSDHALFCSSHGDPICYSGSDGLSSGTDLGCNIGPWCFMSTLSSSGVTCPANESVICDGSSNSDYCTCI
jgi:prepilin-type N-terminal cleavage/methylation domain-containing protein